MITLYMSPGAYSLKLPRACFLEISSSFLQTFTAWSECFQMEALEQISSGIVQKLALKKGFFWQSPKIYFKSLLRLLLEVTRDFLWKSSLKSLEASS